MPSIITHDTFGQDLYKEMHGFIGDGRDEFEAFLLGNQGPDPLFYSFFDPRLRKHIHLGSTMHQEKPNELLVAFKQALTVLGTEEERAIGRSYLFGFACHYLLDSNLHPLVYSYQYQLCGAGIDGLSHENASEVHAIIESELDEIVLFTKRKITIDRFNPAREILKGSDAVLDVISKLYVYVAMTVYGFFVPASIYTSSLKSFRRTGRVFHSKSGFKRDLLGRVEELFRPYSFYRSMSHRALEVEHCSFDNHDHSFWENPYTGEVSTTSFWDIYRKTLIQAPGVLRALDDEGFNTRVAKKITRDLDFSGEPTVAILVMEEGGESCSK